MRFHFDQNGSIFNFVSGQSLISFRTPRNETCSGNFDGNEISFRMKSLERKHLRMRIFRHKKMVHQKIKAKMSVISLGMKSNVNRNFFMTERNVISVLM